MYKKAQHIFYARKLELEAQIDYNNEKLSILDDELRLIKIRSDIKQMEKLLTLNKILHAMCL